MFGAQVGPLEIILVLAIALVILGPKKLPEAGKSLGKGIREFKDSISGDSDRDDRKGLSAETWDDDDEDDPKPRAT